MNLVTLAAADSTINIGTGIYDEGMTGVIIIITNHSHSFIIYYITTSEETSQYSPA